MSIDPKSTDPLPPTLPPNERVMDVKIDGVKVKQTAVIGDTRGIILEVADSRDEFWSEPISYVYLGTCRPGKAKGWGYHQSHTDRYTVIDGEMLLVLFDDRDDSPTKGVVQEFYLTREGRNQVMIPPGVWHAHQNLGQGDLVFLNSPTDVFHHENPDKLRLPLDTDQIPYTFRTELGW
jgi:dTDP-4-dehydrorhamnose 3,5-epimerase